jgi:hypothetical protein
MAKPIEVPNCVRTSEPHKYNILAQMETDRVTQFAMFCEKCLDLQTLSIKRLSVVQG